MPYGSSEEDRLNKWILAQRPPKAVVDPFRPYSFFIEEELSGWGSFAKSATILLTNKECPWRCVMCDLWKHTLDYTVPSGAIPAQIEYALAKLYPHPARVEAEQIKLYNSGSFFDAAAIPPLDYPDIAAKVSFARHVVVESHPRLIGEKTLRFRDLLAGSLEVALGLEAADPGILRRLNKRFTLEEFTRACAFLTQEKIRIRAFILVNPPFADELEPVELAVKSARFAFDCGADVVSLIPTRPGNGALDRLMEAAQFTPPRLATLEEAMQEVLRISRGRVFADTWDLGRFSDCPVCLPGRSERLRAMNLSQAVLPSVVCPACQAGT